MAPVKGESERKLKKKSKTKSVKQRIRSVKRLLSKPDLPATVRVAQERMLELYQDTLEEGQQTRKDEKRKLWRQYRAVTKELQDSPSDDRTKELKELQKKILKDLNYIEYYPSDRKYISLFPAQPYNGASITNKQGELYNHINEKVDGGELPQATFNKDFKEASSSSKRNDHQSRLHVHMDKRKKVQTNSVKSGDLVPSLDGDDFFIDKSGEHIDTE